MHKSKTFVEGKDVSVDNWEINGDFLGGPLIKTPCSPMVGELRFHMPHGTVKEKRRNHQG